MFQRPSHRTLALAAVLVAALAVIGCSNNNNPVDDMLSGPARTAENGLDLVAVPDKIVIDPADPNAPVDANGKRYGESVLTATATDPGGTVQPDLPLTFGTDAGVLASAGAAINTDANGVATDTLRVLEEDPDTVHVSVADGDRITTIVVTKIVVQPPVANAGTDQVVECTGNSSAEVALDGSGSTDPNDDITLFEWFEAFGTPEEKLLGTGETLKLSLPVGAHTITLRVTDAFGKTSTDDVTIAVEDTTPPAVDLRLSPTKIWPPNHRMVDVYAGLDIHDCGDVTVTLESVTSNEPDNGLGDGDTANDIQGAEIGTDDRSFQVRAERAGGGSGRVYTVVYKIVDAFGLESFATAWIRVPHDQGH